jgi:steroid delta-isomerase
MSPEIVAKAVKAYFAAIRETNPDAWVKTFAADAESRDPVDAPPMRGHEELRQFFNRIAGAFKEVGLTEDSVFIVGNQAAVKWTGRGTGQNGRKVHFEGIDIFEVNEDGQIQALRAYWNPLELMAQLQS